MKTNSLDGAIARVTVIDFRWAVETGGDAFARVHDNAERKGSKRCHFGKPAALLAQLTPAPSGRQHVDRTEQQPDSLVQKGPAS